ncbi:putative alpha-ketoglutarate-dependent hypophosphite dioxygenase [Atta colombica]|uniref:Putative alpha-ketoglutarate-dependent hypophosphite dioxygenase n=1 Tax=Atta colombica TaxID=520822 RepID=A0A151I3H1_9HYME|nr:PREDICTED: probable alpha-ketoglutarate-dependent hypophosphite dioxygenase [Atta colombica]KYM83789.1 putative alpha-ketoglutarate-dependent hypophosphite dioxygenase [Atta colombica]
MVALKFLTPEQKQFWDDNGYIKLNIFSTKEINEISDAYTELFERKFRENIGGLESRWTGQDMKKLAGSIADDYTIKSIHNLQMHNDVFTRTITHPKLLDALEDIMGTEDIMLHHTKAHLKPPEKGSPYLMHQDYPYFPHKKHTMLAVFLHLDDTTSENGGLAIYPGSHKLGPLKEIKTTDDWGDPIYYVDPKEYPLSKATPISAKKGEVVFFSYLTLHGSYLNLSDKTRRMFLIQVRAADDEPTEDVHNSPCQGLMLRGKNIYKDALITNRYKY